MKRAVALAAFLALATSSLPRAHAMWVKLSEAELISTSELVVNAELIGQTYLRFAADRPRLLIGVLRVDEVLKGDPAIGVALLVLPSDEGPGASTDLLYRKGQRGLWLLRALHGADGGLYLADHPQRFVPLEHTAQIAILRRLLKR